MQAHSRNRNENCPIRMFNKIIWICVVATCCSIATATDATLSEVYSRDEILKTEPGFGNEWMYLSDQHNNTIIGYFEHSEPQLFAQSYDLSKSVTFTLYTRTETRGLKVVHPGDLISSAFNKNRPTRMVIHGWQSSGTSQTCQGIKDGFLRNYDVNVFIVDWSPITGNIYYPTPAAMVPDVATYVSEFVNDLIWRLGVNPKQMHIVGHSLGAHVAGIIGQRIHNTKLARVTGLDPAKPKFGDLTQRISKESADFVDIIHTCAGYLGLAGELGHVDFFPNNGGPSQPGCGRILVKAEACSHSRAWEFFVESLQNPYQPFYAVACSSWDEFKHGGCSHDASTIKMGEQTPPTASGNYYLTTSDKKPYSLGMKGLH